MRGRKPVPLQRRLVEGDPRRSARALDRAMEALPKAMRGLPDPPRHLTGLAREQWFIWARELQALEMDFAADAVALEGACVNYARAIEADEILKDGCEVEEPRIERLTGEVIGHRLKNHPAVTRSNLCWGLVKTFCSSLGLSPASRRSVGFDPSEAGGGNDDLRALLLGPRAKRDDDDPVN